jgi:hypothetical protein
MTAVPQPENVRQLVVRAFEEFGARPRTPWDLKETILIDQGKCMARSYRLYGYMAMWLVDTGILQFYDAEGNMLRTVNLFEQLLPQREAA